MSTGQTKMWTIDEHPGYTIEQTPGAWVLWGPCIDHEYPPESELFNEDSEECVRCGHDRRKGTSDGEYVVEICSLDVNSHEVFSAVIGSKSWIPRRIQ